MEGCTLQERCNYFAKQGKNDPTWAFSNIIRYVQSEKNRVEQNKSPEEPLEILSRLSRCFVKYAICQFPGRKLVVGCPEERDTQTTEHQQLKR